MVHSSVLSLLICAATRHGINDENLQTQKDQLSQLAKLSVNDDTTGFYNKYKGYFDSYTFYSDNSEENERIKADIYSMTNIGNEKPNSFFLFTSLADDDSDVDIDAFIEKALKESYFIENMYIFQQK